MRKRARAPIGALFLLAALPALAADGIYRWTDDDGNAHYGDRPPPGAERLDDGETEDDGFRYHGASAFPTAIPSTCRTAPRSE